MTDLKGVKIGNTTYPFDYEYLANRPPEVPQTGGTDGYVLTLAASATGGMAWAAAPSGVPSHANSDKGKVLTVNNTGNVAWKAVPEELPYASPADAGDVLIANSYGRAEWESIDSVLGYESASVGDVLAVGGTEGGPYVEWQTLATVEALPSFSEYDEGKCLMVDDYGSLMWQEPLPSSTSQDQECILIVNSTGEPTWSSFTFPDPTGQEDSSVLVTSGTGGSMLWQTLKDALGSPDNDTILVCRNNELEWVYLSDTNIVIS